MNGVHLLYFADVILSKQKQNMIPATDSSLIPFTLWIPGEGLPACWTMAFCGCDFSTSSVDVRQFRPLIVGLPSSIGLSWQPCQSI
jgi:hypothetical protein